MVAFQLPSRILDLDRTKWLLAFVLFSFIFFIFIFVILLCVLDWADNTNVFVWLVRYVQPRQRRGLGKRIRKATGRAVRRTIPFFRRHTNDGKCCLLDTGQFQYTYCHFILLSTRKPSWCKGKCATAVRVWRPLEKTSAPNQQYTNPYWWLTVAVAVLLTLCAIFSI